MIPTTGTPIVSDTTQPAVIAPPIAPMSAPVYQPPTESVIPPNPVIAPPPDGQTRGEGGTPFGSRPSIYLAPYDINSLKFVGDETNADGFLVQGEGVTPTPVPGDRFGKPPIPRPFILPPAPGKDQIMPVPTGQQPTQPPIKTAVESVTKPAGPITGTIAGFDLARVPFWAWLVGAAFLGSRLLK